MCLSRGDAHANSHRWPTVHRQNLYCDEDQLSPDASLELLLDRRDEIEDANINAIRRVHQFLVNEYFRNKIKANSGVRSWRFYRSSTRLPVSRRLARVALWAGVCLDAAIISKAGVFLADGRLGTSFSKRGKSDSLRRTYCG